jgi:hypothetical protein
MRYQDRRLANERLEDIQSEYAPGDRIRLSGREFTIARVTPAFHQVLVVDDMTGDTLFMGLPTLDIAQKID